MRRAPTPWQPPTIKKCVRVMGPTKNWAGHCFEVAHEMVDQGLAPGVAVYGHWLGKVHPGSIFANKAPFCRHGWIALPDGRICDPTRWVFECAKPYIYVGPAGDEYDEGGNRLKARMLRPPPPYDPDEPQFSLPQHRLASEAYMHVERLLTMDLTVQEPGVVCLSQLHWIATLPIDMLKPHVKAIYEAIETLGQSVLIPWDNQQMCDRGAA